MKMFVWAVLAAVAAAPAVADGQAIQLANCQVSETLLERYKVQMNCDVSNISETAVSHFSYSYVTRSEGRTVPWVQDQDVTKWVSGGIEPGETINLSIDAGYLPSRADTNGIVVDLYPTSAFDVDGTPIE